MRTAVTQQTQTESVRCLFECKTAMHTRFATMRAVSFTVDHMPYRSCTETELVATAQSVLLLLTALLFGFGEDATLPHSDTAKLLIEVWGVKQALAATGLFAEAETHSAAISWHNWACVQAKRRTLLSLNHLEWAWSVQAGYPVLTCFELGPLYAPAAGYLWRATKQSTWEASYIDWLRKWSGEGYRMAEFFHLDPAKPLDRRSEMWLAEADEFGMVLMAEANAVVPAG
ncbi:uncharacterized protein LTR77_005659 [Saxophila tyrrhenica]|uniref:Uncharacterized protein n=1 Tax=Saxophila tyrrhenica TaxID=1690608 RepID=A0AAV9P934_9PEZI|nr:hypothetical protein LTR77_005659 [Saxophila tyrrhenica]